MQFSVFLGVALVLGVDGVNTHIYAKGWGASLATAAGWLLCSMVDVSFASAACDATRISTCCASPVKEAGLQGDEGRREDCLGHSCACFLWLPRGRHAAYNQVLSAFLSAFN
jgi:hypothetical protein